MRRADVHRAWARPGGRWSPWVKPIVFASLDEDRTPQPLGEPPAWLVPEVIDPLAALARSGESYRTSSALPTDVALVVDLPAAEGARVGIALASHGFAPVPLYNALFDEAAVVDVRPVRDALVDGAAFVRDVPEAAPPAFLLDASRLGIGRVVHEGDFDNRSFCTASDFPSVETLRAAGVRRAVLIRRGEWWPGADLAGVLLDWQRGGLQLFLVRADVGGSFAPRDSLRPPFSVRVGQWVLRRLFHRRTDGTFGELVRGPSGG